MTLAPAWRLLQVALGAVLFAWAFGWLDALRLQRLPYLVLMALLAAGAMAVTDSLVSLAAAVFARNRHDLPKGPRE